MEPVLCVEKLHIVAHDHDADETLVSDFSLTMQEGEIVGLVGESGSGKSLSAMAIAGLLSRHDMEKSGHIIMDGIDLLSCERNVLRAKQGKDIGIIFQEPMTSLNPVKKIGWQVEEALRIHTNMDKDERRRAALEALAGASLTPPEKIYEQYPHELSGGMRQRVMIAAAMICKPKLLIADEPSTALDVTVQAQIIRLLKQLNREYHTAILFISHDLSLVSQIAGRVVVMKDGRIVEEGNTKEVFESPREAYTEELIAAIPTCNMCHSQIHRDIVLYADKLCVSYPKYVTKGIFTKKEWVKVLNDVHFLIKRGEIVGLVGKSGCGKSTLAKALVNMTPHEGTLLSEMGQPQMVFQDPYGSLNPKKKIQFLLEEPLKNQTKMDASERLNRAKEALAEVGLDEKFLQRYPSELSGGQRQRVGIACALMMHPQFLIADEPVSALDVTVQAQIIALLLELQKKRDLTILFISHDLRVVYELCNYILVMDEGKIVEHGSVTEIYENPQSDVTKSLLKDAGLRE